MQRAPITGRQGQSPARGFRRRAAAPGAQVGRATRAASLADLAERMRARLEQCLAADDETLFQGRDNGVALLLRLTEVIDRIALMDAATDIDATTPDAADRAILERYVAWRLRRYGIATGVEGVPPPEPTEGSDPDRA